MKKHFLLTCLLSLGLCVPAAMAQSGPMKGPRFNAAMAKLFGDNTSFSANMESSVVLRGNQMSVPGKIYFADGKSRMEMNMSDIKGGQFPPAVLEQLKSIGMDSVVAIGRPDKKLNYLIYPGVQAYAQIAMDAGDELTADKFKLETTELGKETVDGHPCIKNKAVVTNPDGQAHESTVWNATDLKNFPVKIETLESGNTVTLAFKNVQLAKPNAAMFETPASFKAYDNAQTLMMSEAIKHAPTGAGGPPPQH